MFKVYTSKFLCFSLLGFFGFLCFLNLDKISVLVWLFSKHKHVFFVWFLFWTYTLMFQTDFFLNLFIKFIKKIYNFNFNSQINNRLRTWLKIIKIVTASLFQFIHILFYFKAAMDSTPRTLATPATATVSTTTRPLVWKTPLRPCPLTTRLNPVRTWTRMDTWCLVMTS